MLPIAVSVPSCAASHLGGTARVVGVAGGVGTTTVAVALGGVDLGRVAVQQAEVVVCRLAVDSLVRAARVAALMVGCGPRRVLAVTAMDAAKPSRALVARLELLEPHAAAVVILPFVAEWRDALEPLREVRSAMRSDSADLPRPVRGYIEAISSITEALRPQIGSAALGTHRPSALTPGEVGPA